MFIIRTICSNLTCDFVFLRPLGQAVKTPPSQGGIMGSIPVGVTTKILKEDSKMMFYFFFYLNLSN